MKEIILFKGKYEVINMPEYKEVCNKLYEFFIKLVKQRGYSCKIVETNSTLKVEDHISSDTEFLIGHSMGCERILDEFNPIEHPHVKGVLLIDPKDTYKQKWNEFPGRKLLIVSKKGHEQNYAEFHDRIELDDDHFFNNSFEKLEIITTKFIS